MKISIINSQALVRIDSGGLEKTASGALEAVGEKKAELSVYIVDDSEIKRLNFHYRGVDRPTDVLAFSMREGENLKGTEGILGDVVISTETAVKQARSYKRKIKDEINLYLVHGILHLAGYDDVCIRGRKEMEKMQNRILASLRAERSEAKQSPSSEIASSPLRGSSQ